MFSEQDQSQFRILLTGGTGFFGRALLRKWQSNATSGDRIPKICVLSRNPKKFLDKYPEFYGQGWLDFHQGDILVPDSLPLKDTFTHILHAATDSTFGPQLKPLERYIQIVDGTRNLLDYAVKKCVSRFLLTSSGGVYGKQPHDMLSISENYNGMPDPLNPENAYSIAKRSAEHLCTLYREQYSIKIVIARCFSFVGQDLPLKVHFAIGNFIHEALQENVIHVKGDGTPVRTYLDQRDLAHWLTEMLFKGSDGEVYNVGSDVPITIKELAQLVRDTIAPNKTVVIDAESKDINYRNRYVPDITKACSQLNLKISYSLQESILNTISTQKDI